MNRPEKELKVRCAFDNQGQLVIPYKDIKKQWEELNEYCDYLERNRKVKIATVDVKCSDFEEIRQWAKKCQMHIHYLLINMNNKQNANTVHCAMSVTTMIVEIRLWLIA